jgi:hypothetical protein
MACVGHELGWPRAVLAMGWYGHRLGLLCDDLGFNGLGLKSARHGLG